MSKKRAANFVEQKQGFSIPLNISEIKSVLDVREGESTIVTYTSADTWYKIAALVAFVREGLKSGDAVNYVCPDEERLAVWAMLKNAGIDVEKYEKDGTLLLESLTEHFMPNGILDYKKAVNNSLDRWFDAERKGYKHLRDIEDVGNFFFCEGKWKKFATEYWLDPRWDEPNVSLWAVSKEPVGLVYKPFIMEITAIDIGNMSEVQVTNFLKTLGRGTVIRTRIINPCMEGKDIIF